MKLCARFIYLAGSLRAVQISRDQEGEGDSCKISCLITGGVSVSQDIWTVKCRIQRHPTHYWAKKPPLFNRKFCATSKKYIKNFVIGLKLWILRPFSQSFSLCDHKLIMSQNVYAISCFRPPLFRTLAPGLLRKSAKNTYVLLSNIRSTYVPHPFLIIIYCLCPISDEHLWFPSFLEIFLAGAKHAAM